jgi:hypothetical protein
MDPDVARLGARLELDPAAETVVGTITTDDGVERRFSGWMELASAIEAWRTESSPDTGRDTGQTTPRGPSRR